jgi:hypothetical protein
MSFHRALVEWKILQDHVFPLLITYGDDPEVLYECMVVMYLMTCLPPTPKIELDDDKDVKKSKWRTYGAGAVPSFECLANIKEQFARSTDAVTVVMKWLIEPLQHVGHERSESETIVLDLALNLIRNLLQLHPAVESEIVLPATLRVKLHTAQDMLLQKFADENVLEMLVLLAQNVEEDENRNWNMLLLDIMGLVFVKEDPAEVLASMDVVSGRWLMSERHKELQSKVARASVQQAKRTVIGKRFVFLSVFFCSVTWVSHLCWKDRELSKQRQGFVGIRGNDVKLLVFFFFVGVIVHSCLGFWVRFVSCRVSSSRMHAEFRDQTFKIRFPGTSAWQDHFSHKSNMHILTPPSGPNTNWHPCYIFAGTSASQDHFSHRCRTD